MEKVDIINKHVSFLIDDESKVGEARRRIKEWLMPYNFSEEFFSDTNIIINELGTNLVKYANKKGELIFRLLFSNDHKGLEIISVDSGPGINSVQKVIQDGISTGKTRGVGLGAVKRLSNHFEIFSAENKGTFIFCQKYEGTVPPHNKEYGYICLPIHGNLFGGDAVVFSEIDNLKKICVIDGLGHGEMASEAARIAGEVFLENSEKELTDILALQDAALRSTRGAALTLIELDFDNMMISHLGIGNITSRLIHEWENKWMLSNPGIVGLLKIIKEPMKISMAKNDVLVMNSDGLKTFQANEELRGMSNFSSTLLSAYLYKNYNRVNDDSIVVVFKV